MDRRARRLGILDTKMAQAAAIFVALAVVKLVPRIMDVDIWWFIGLAVLCGLKPVYTFYVDRRASLHGGPGLPA